jgi:OOP family OmpA-OmpF porin
MLHSHFQSHSRSPIGARRLAQTAACLLLPLAALAQNTSTAGYVLDAQGGFVRNSPGQCWRNGEWTPALAMPACDPVLQPVAVAAAPVAAPSPMAPPPVVAAAPKAVPVVAPMPKQTLRYASETLFGFDKSSISPAGKKVLDEASANILGMQGEQVEVVGHTDRIGSVAYNQKLSLQRAEAVRDYLATKGVPADRMAARGAGETEPVTMPGTCTKGSNAQVIACLQPDRRVDIEAQGTKIATP